MPKVYACAEGATIHLDGIGDATTEIPVIVSAEVAEGLAGASDLRIESDDAPAPQGFRRRSQPAIDPAIGGDKE